MAEINFDSILQSISSTPKVNPKALFQPGNQPVAEPKPVKAAKKPTGKAATVKRNYDLPLATVVETVPPNTETSAPIAAQPGPFVPVEESIVEPEVDVPPVAAQPGPSGPAEEPIVDVPVVAAQPGPSGPKTKAKPAPKAQTKAAVKGKVASKTTAVVPPNEETSVSNESEEPINVSEFKLYITPVKSSPPKAPSTPVTKKTTVAMTNNKKTVVAADVSKYPQINGMLRPTLIKEIKRVKAAIKEKGIEFEDKKFPTTKEEMQKELVRLMDILEV